MTHYTETVVTNHALTRFRQHTMNLAAGDQTVCDVVNEASPVTKKSDAWYAPFVRQKVVPGTCYFYHEGSSLVFVCESAGHKLRVVTCYPISFTLENKLMPKSAKTLARSARRRARRMVGGAA